MHSRTVNKIYPLGGRHAALQAGAWSYGRHGSGTGWQEGASPLGGGPQMKPHNRQRLTRGEVKLALSPTEGSVLPDLPCLVCHCNVSSEWRVLIVGEDVREHGLEMGLTTSLMSCPASSSSGHKNTQIKGLEFVSSFKRHLRCCSRLQIFRVRLISTC